MTEVEITRPRFPPGYAEHPTGHVAWSWVERQLQEAIHFWLCTVRPDGRPHAVPKWAVWVDGALYFDGSSKTRHARNMAIHPDVVVHLESGEQALILEGKGQAIGRPEAQLALRIAAAYRRKYAALGYAPEPSQWDEGGLFVVVPSVILAWTKFHEDPTKFTLKPAKG
jgi:nitroimidazol reductase NimA-like FMN-containing flavoprotein (pyridoxamine 5'-phosphate oxidase superfamily)